MTNLLSVQGLIKNFGRTAAVDDVSFDLGPGESLGVIGPNGSGKTTLVNLITGFVKPTMGKIYYHDRDITGLAPYKTARLGLTRTFQTARPYLRLQTFQNAIVPLFSNRLKKIAGRGYGGKEAVAMDLLEEVGFERDSLAPYKQASSLPHGYLKRLELARCLALQPDLIIMDEIFSGLSLAEVTGLTPIIHRLKKQGVAIIMVEHRLRELFQVTSRIAVLNFGRIIASGTPQEVLSDPEVKSAYLGAD